MSGCIRTAVTTIFDGCGSSRSRASKSLAAQDSDRCTGCRPGHGPGGSGCARGRRFRTKLDTTVLGTALNTQVRPFHVVLAGLTLALGSAAAAQVVLLAWLSRRRQLGVLKALGWSGRRLASLVCCQALMVGAGGAAVAAPVVVAGAELLDASAGAVGRALAATIAGCLAATIVAAVGPGLLALRVPARRLRGGLRERGRYREGTCSADVRLKSVGDRAPLPDE
jgi:hypothetical protein